MSSNPSMPDETAPIPVALGVGCRRDCPPEALRQLAMTTLALAGLRPDQITLMATLEGRQSEAAIASLATGWHCPLMALPAEALQESEPDMSHVSDAARRVHGVPGVAEAAALAAIRRHTGAPARLRVTRQQCACATCALAVPASMMALTESFPLSGEHHDIHRDFPPRASQDSRHCGDRFSGQRQDHPAVAPAAQRRRQAHRRDRQ
ncbi:cobalamin biosynthesis protein [Kushneria sp. AK178]